MGLGAWILRTLSRALSALIYVTPTAYGQLKIVKKFKLGLAWVTMSVFLPIPGTPHE